MPPHWRAKAARRADQAAAADDADFHASQFRAVMIPECTSADWIGRWNFTRPGPVRGAAMQTLIG